MRIRENFLHYLWKHKILAVNKLTTVDQEALVILRPGLHNTDSGPDFFNAQLRINDQKWVGNVEIHLRSSDWYVHHHETDQRYDNVILHVVWEHDAEIFRRDNTGIPTLEIRNFVSKELLSNYFSLFSGKESFVSCEKDLGSVPDFIVSNWLERLYIERLEQKSILVTQLFEALKGDWESVLFRILTHNFGLKVNGVAFTSLAGSFDFRVLRKLQYRQQSLEALFFGQAGFLSGNHSDPYFMKLKEEYRFIRHKYLLEPMTENQFQFFRLRPQNFPTIRIAQLAELYSTKKHLFSSILGLKNISDFYTLFSTGTSEFWKNHYHFSSVSKTAPKRMSKDFIDLLLINTILPVLFTYQKLQGKGSDERIIDLIRQIKPEKNSVITKFKETGIPVKNALHTQAILRLKKEYCDRKKCLECAVGNALLSRH